MLIFLASFSAIALAALGLGIGALRGRPLAGGSCGEGYLAAHQLPRCTACPARPPRPDASR